VHRAAHVAALFDQHMRVTMRRLISTRIPPGG